MPSPACKTRGQFLPARIEAFGAWQLVEAALLDAMQQLARLARGRHKVVPAARDVGFFVDAEDAPGDGVAVMMFVEEPAVKASLADCGLHRVDIHTGHDTRAGPKSECNIYSE